MKRNLILLTAILTLCLTSPVFGEIRGGELNGSFLIGGYTFDSSQHMKANVAHGLRLGYDITKNWGVETQFTEVTLKSTSAAVTKTGEQYSIRGDILYHFMPQSKLVPFVVLGGGWSTISKFYGGNEDATLDYGVGVKYFLNDWLALRMDLREILSFHDSAHNGTTNWHNYEYTAGLSVQFDRAMATAPPVLAEESPVRMAESLPTSSQPAKTAQTVTPAPVRVLEPAPEPVTAEPKDTPPPVRRAVKSSAPCNCSQQAIATIVLGADNVEVVTDIGFDTYNVFQLTEPTRLVVDVCCTNDGMGSKESKYAFNRWGVSTVRVAGHPNKLRIVFDTKLSRFPGYRIETTATGIKVLLNDW